MLSSVPLERNHLRVFSRSFALCSGVRRETEIDPSLSKEGSCSSLEPTPVFLTQSRALSISRARASGFSPRFVGSIASNLRKSPVGSLTSSFFPLLRIQFKVSSRSFDRCSGVRRAIGVDPSFLKSLKASLSPGDTWLFRIQSSAPSI